MTATAPPPSDDPPVSPPRLKPRPKLRRAGIWALAGVFVIAMALTIASLWLAGKPVSAPDWLRDRIETRINNQMSGGFVRFGDVVLQVERRWRPSVHLRDVRLTADSGAPIASVADVSASLAMRPLLKGLVQPKHIALTGVLADLKRDADGRVVLSLGGNITPVGKASNMAQLIEGIDKLLAQPTLGALVEIKVDAITLRYEDVRAARGWTIDGGLLRLDRTGNDLRLSGSFAVLGGGANVALVQMNYNSRIGSNAASFGINVTDVDAADIAVHTPALAWLNVLRAPISGALRGRILENGAVGPLSATLQIAQGVVQPTDQTAPIPFDAARSYFTYSPATQTIQFDELSVESKWVTGRAEGSATLGEIKDGKLGDLVAQFSVSELVVNPPGLYEHPVALDGASADLHMRLDPFVLTLGQVHISDQGNSLRVWGDLRAAKSGWQLALDGEMDEMSPERLLQLWPKAVVGNTRTWLENNLLAARLENIDVALRATPGNKPDILLNFDYSDADVRFMKTMPLLRQASGNASLLRNRFVITADKGFVTGDQGGRIDVAGTSFIVPDIMVKKGAPAVVKLRIDSTVTAALSLLDRKPLNVMSKANIPVTVADGRVVLQGTLALPLIKYLKTKDVVYHAQGELTSVRSSVLLDGRIVAAERLSISASSERISISGPGRIGAVGFDGRWDQALGAGPDVGSTLTGTIELSERVIDEFNIGLPPGSVSGAGLANVQIALKRGQPPVLYLRSTLVGIGLDLVPVGWSKPPATPGELILSGTLGPQPDIARISLIAPGLSAQGGITTKPDGGLGRASFSKVKIGDWLDAPVVLSGNGRGRAPNVSVSGGTVDLRRAKFNETPNRNARASGPLSVMLDRLQITDTIALTGFRGQFSTANGMDGKFEGKVNGGTTVSGRLAPQNGRTAMRITSSDAGGVAGSADVLKQARGGDMTLTLVPVGAAGTFDGSLRVTGTRITRAPAMAELLNAISVVGLLEQLNGPGIHFTEVDARFRLTPSRITVVSSSAIGTSMGLSMDGIFNMDNGVFDMQGVLTPVYLINGIGSVLTRKGEGIFGFNFTLTGTAQSPRVQVNPLSALTPGMFREIFRRAPPVIEGGAIGTRAPRVQTEPVVQEDTSR